MKEFSCLEDTCLLILTNLRQFKLEKLTDRIDLGTILAMMPKLYSLDIKFVNRGNFKQFQDEVLNQFSAIIQNDQHR